MENVEVFVVEGVKALTRMLRRRSAEVWLPPQGTGAVQHPLCPVPRGSHRSHHSLLSCCVPRHGPLAHQHGSESAPTLVPHCKGASSPGRVVLGKQWGSG